MFVLLSGLPGSGKCRLIESVLNNFDEVIWITTLTSASFVKKRVKRNIWILDTITWGRSSVDDRVIVSNPINLNEVSLAISKILEKIDGRYLVVLNSISGLLIYHPHQKLVNFLRTVMGRIEAEDGRGIFTLVKGAQERSVEIAVLMFFPNVLEVEGRIRVLKSAVPMEKNEFEFEEGKDLILKMLEM
ncbi:MAG: hypothetical protein ABWW66_00095 [Archaeoglobaceae archaeon]